MNITEWIAYLRDVAVTETARLFRLEAAWKSHYYLYGIELSSVRASAFSQAVAEHSLDDIERAFAHWMRQPAEKGHKPRPCLPCDVLALLHQSMHPEDMATEIVVGVWNAIGRYGYTQPKKVEAAVGPIGWDIIKRFGGLTSLSSQLNTADRGIFIAQARALAETLMIRDRQLGQSDERQIFKQLESAVPQAALPKPEAQAPKALTPEPEREASPGSMAQFMEMVGALAKAKALPAEA